MDPIILSLPSLFITRGDKGRQIKRVEGPVSPMGRTRWIRNLSPSLSIEPMYFDTDAVGEEPGNEPQSEKNWTVIVDRALKEPPGKNFTTTGAWPWKKINFTPNEIRTRLIGRSESSETQSWGTTQLVPAPIHKLKPSHNLKIPTPKPPAIFILPDCEAFPLVHLVSFVQLMLTLPPQPPIGIFLWRFIGVPGSPVTIRCSVCCSVYCTCPTLEAHGSKAPPVHH